jgi:hypothetical protein
MKCRQKLITIFSLQISSYLLFLISPYHIFSGKIYQSSIVKIKAACNESSNGLGNFFYSNNHFFGKCKCPTITA